MFVTVRQVIEASPQVAEQVWDSAEEDDAVPGGQVPWRVSLALLDAVYSGSVRADDDDGMLLVPGDLWDLERRRASSSYRHEPSLILVAAGLKYGPCRDSLEHHFSKLRLARPYAMTPKQLYQACRAGF